MKTKILILLMLLPMMVNALGEFEHCSWQGQCDNGLYCYGYSKGVFKCYSTTAHRGAYVPYQNYNPCYGYLKVALVPDAPSYYQCAECELDMHTNQPVDSEGPYDLPGDLYCRNGGYNCSCDFKNGQSWNDYPRWNHVDNHGDQCDDTVLGNKECYTGLRCQETGIGTRKCLIADENCVLDSDCQSDYYCARPINMCTLLLIPTTSTATSSTSTTLNIRDECQTDPDCSPDKFCQTGFTPYKYCASKLRTYIQNPKNSGCYKNHGCLSDLCSSDTINQHVGDYPPYTGSDPYEGKSGNCIPSPFDVSISISPKILTKFNNVVVNAITTKAQKPYTVSSCIYNFMTLSQLPDDNSSVSWAYDSQGNTYYDLHNMLSISNGNWVSSEQANINQTIESGSYGTFVKCTDQFGNVGQNIAFTEVTNGNETIIKITNLPNNPSYNSFDTIIINYRNYLGVGLPSANCIMRMNNSNYTMSVDLSLNYYQTVTFNVSGNNQIDFFCNKTGYENAYISANIFVNAPHCFNQIQDSGEEGIDCGGTECSQCDASKKSNGDSCSSDNECLSDYCSDGLCADKEVPTECADTNYTINTCSSDGSRYCILNTMKCVYNNCTTTADCYDVRIFNSSTGSYTRKSTTCDTSSGLCKIPGQDTSNGTTYDLGMDITPIPSSTQKENPVYVNGEYYNVFNCEDGKNGFNIHTNTKTTTWYKIIPTLETPSIGVMTDNKICGNSGTTDKECLIPELCTTVNGQGGIPSNSQSGFGIIQFYSSTDKKQLIQTVNVIVYRKSLKNSVSVDLLDSIGGNQFYSVNATNRSIMVYAKTLSTDNYVNLTSNYTNNILFNLSILNQNPSVTGNRIYYRIESLYGEVDEDSTGSLAWWLFPCYDPKAKWGVNCGEVKVQPWHVYILLALIVVALVYANYRLRANRKIRIPGA